MKIVISMPEPRRPECELCGHIHGPKEVCAEELEGIYMTPAWMTEESEDENN